MRQGNTFDAWWKRRWGKPLNAWWAKQELEQTRWRDHMFASGDAWNYSRGHQQVIHKGRKP